MDVKACYEESHKPMTRTLIPSGRRRHTPPRTGSGAAPAVEEVLTEQMASRRLLPSVSVDLAGRDHSKLVKSIPPVT